MKAGIAMLIVALLLTVLASGALLIRRKNLRLPLLTVGMCAVLVLCFVLQDTQLLAVVRRDGAAIAAGQVWRLVTALFFQDGPLIPGGLFNFIILLLVGGVAEQLLTRREWLLFYFTVGIATELVAVAMQPVGAGNSIAVFGLAGSLLALPSPPRVKVISVICRLGGTALALALVAHGDIHGVAFMTGCVVGAIWQSTVKAPTGLPIVALSETPAGG